MLRIYTIIIWVRVGIGCSYLVTRFQIIFTFLVDEMMHNGPEIVRFLNFPQHGPVLPVLIMEQWTEMGKSYVEHLYETARILLQ